MMKDLTSLIMFIGTWSICGSTRWPVDRCTAPSSWSRFYPDPEDRWGAGSSEPWSRWQRFGVTAHHWEDLGGPIRTSRWCQRACWLRSTCWCTECSGSWASLSSFEAGFAGTPGWTVRRKRGTFWKGKNQFNSIVSCMEVLVMWLKMVVCEVPEARLSVNDKTTDSDEVYFNTKVHIYTK